MTYHATGSCVEFEICQAWAMRGGGGGLIVALLLREHPVAALVSFAFQFVSWECCHAMARPSSPHRQRDLYFPRRTFLQTDFMAIGEVPSHLKYPYSVFFTK